MHLTKFWFHHLTWKIVTCPNFRQVNQYLDFWPHLTEDTMSDKSGAFWKGKSIWQVWYRGHRKDSYESQGGWMLYLVECVNATDLFKVSYHWWVLIFLTHLDKSPECWAHLIEDTMLDIFGEFCKGGLSCGSDLKAITRTIMGHNVSVCCVWRNAARLPT